MQSICHLLVSILIKPFLLSSTRVFFRTYLSKQRKMKKKDSFFICPGPLLEYNSFLQKKKKNVEFSSADAMHLGVDQHTPNPKTS